MVQMTYNPVLSKPSFLFDDKYDCFRLVNIIGHDNDGYRLIISGTGAVIKNEFVYQFDIDDENIYQTETTKELCTSTNFELNVVNLKGTSNINVIGTVYNTYKGNPECPFYSTQIYGHGIIPKGSQILVVPNDLCYVKTEYNIIVFPRK